MNHYFYIQSFSPIDNKKTPSNNSLSAKKDNAVNKKTLSLMEWAELCENTQNLINKAKICSGDADLYDACRFCGMKDSRTVSKIKNNTIVNENEMRFCSKWLISDMYKQMEKLLEIITNLNFEGEAPNE